MMPKDGTGRLRLSRRTLLQGMLGARVLLPMAGLLETERAQAAVAKRVLFVYVPDGCIPAVWHPSGTETAFSLPEMSAPLESIRQHLVFVDGLTMYAGGSTHEGGFAKLLTGVGPQSLDVFLGDRISMSTPFRSLQLGVHATFQNGAGSISYVGAGQQITPDDDPTSVFKRVFGTAPGAGGDDSGLRRRRSVLDASLADLAALQKKLGTSERQKLDVHLASLREVEARLSGGSSTCVAPDLHGFSVSPTDYYPKTYHKEEKFRLVGELQMDMTVLALACGATNVASLTWSHPVSPTHIMETGVTTGNHDASHYGEPNSQNARDFVKLKRWFMDRFVYLVNKLANTPDGSGSLLDNTLVLLCSELGDSNLHDHARVPFVLAGKAGGALRTGRFLDYRGKHNGENEPHTKLLVSVARALDVDIDSFGYTGHGTGPLAGLLG
jgi:hypothetical protein